MQEKIMVVADLLDHNPGQSLIEILYLSTKMPYHVMTSQLKRNGYSLFILPEDDVEHRAEERLRRQKPEATEQKTGDGNGCACVFPRMKIEEECAPAFIEFLMGLEKCAKADKQRAEEAAEKAADEHAKKLELARQELDAAITEEEKMRRECRRVSQLRANKLEAYLDLLEERRRNQW